MILNVGESSGRTALTGYDKPTKKYVMAWLDFLSTDIQYFDGNGSADGKTNTQESSYDDPVRGSMDWRSIIRIVKDDTPTHEMYLTRKGAREKRR